MAFSALSWTCWEREAEDEQKLADRDWVRSWVPMKFWLRQRVCCKAITEVGQKFLRNVVDGEEDDDDKD
ncbi:hypothetical protein C1H46_011451 [Malus baccata]|uniref:Uncharacterized protein n=1 Tax=Malus baccata TaxID=106549 RepID=A0A540MVY9_MALBA|nr:hypothetical protein C1H46_011451 [Malus baccata]